MRAAQVTRFRAALVGFVALLWMPGCGKDDPPRHALAEGCTQNSDCAPGLVCTFERCHVECETSRDCPAGARCVAASDGATVCQLAAEESCAYNSECPEPLVCAGDSECRNECLEDRDCVRGQTCTTSQICAEPEEVDEEGNLIVDGAGGTGGSGDTGGTGGDAAGGPGEGGEAGDPVASGGVGAATGGAGGVGGTGGEAGGAEPGVGGAGGVDTTGGTGGAMGATGGAGGDAGAGTGTGAGGATGGTTTGEGGTTGGAGGVDGSGGDAGSAEAGSGGSGGVGGTTGGIGGTMGGAAGAGGTNGGAPVTVFSDAFESGLGTWYAENGVWEVGTPTVEPVGCYEGTSCAGTVLDGDAPYTSSRLISPRVTLPTLEPGEELQLRYWHWFQFSGSGQIEVSVWDEGTSAWLEWQAAGDPAGDHGSGGWSRKGVDLAAYAGQQVRFGFSYDPIGGYPGWTVDGVEVVRFTPNFSVDFELGWGDWYADNGSWPGGHADGRAGGVPRRGELCGHGARWRRAKSDAFPSHLADRDAAPCHRPESPAPVLELVQFLWQRPGADHRLGRGNEHLECLAERRHGRVRDLHELDTQGRGSDCLRGSAGAARVLL